MCTSTRTRCAAHPQGNRGNNWLTHRKINLFRVAFLLERMCPLSYGLGAKFNETHFDYFKQAIDYITVKKGACKSTGPRS